MRVILTVLGVLLILSSCEKDPKEEVARKFLSVDLDSLIVIAENPTAVVSAANLTDTDPTNDIDKLTIVANGELAERVTIILLGNTEGLTRNIFHSQDGNSLSIYYPDLQLSQIADQHHGHFTLELTNVQDSLIEATFSARLVDTTGVYPDRNASFGFLRAVVTGN